jgi:hypothetical protein
MYLNKTKNKDNTNNFNQTDDFHSMNIAHSKVNNKIKLL